jgi:hypothetical protein
MVPHQKIDPGFLPAQKQNSITYFSRFSNAHIFLSSLFLFFRLLEEGVGEQEEGESRTDPGEDISIKGIKGFSI